MRELRDVVAAIRRTQASGQACALATVVGARGSTYRREGARLLVTATGHTVGSISGGCLEGDVQIVAEEVMRDGRPRRLHYDLTADDEAVWGLGLGCNGVIDVLVERIDATEPSPQEFLARAVEKGASLAVVTVIGPEDSPHLGRRIVWEDDRTHAGTLGDPSLDREARRLAARALASGRPSRAEIEGIEVFVEPIQPPPRLVVCGAGHDAIPLVRFADAVGFRTVVLDRREKFLTPERFPEAHAFVVTEFPRAAEEIRPDDRTCIVVMTHNYLHDRNLVRSFLTWPEPPAYLGLLGPRQRTEKILRELADEGVRPSEALRGRIFAPVGLDIGAEGPEQIAVAIVAEILAARSGRAGGHLRERRAAIHAAAT
ncbi:MAG: XdhC family protein [Armatimonadota bacterium]|nr:XdhC family protein [Armatimonadota bacterium]MDR5696187.1 XdhC family protein [Armatimonadota bacterium]